MTSTQVLDLKGKKVGDVELEDTVFGIDFAQGPLHTALTRQRANARSGSASTLTRSEVRGGGRKPWRQKGTGRARAGSIRSPLWNGGGIIFGPKPRSYYQSMPKKMRALAIRSALSARKEDLVVVKDFDAVKEAKTKAFFQILEDLKIAGKKILVVLDFKCDACKYVQLSARNIANLKVIHSTNLNIKDLFEYEVLLTSERTLTSINESLKTDKKAQPKQSKSKAEKKKKPAPRAPKAKKPPAKKKETSKAPAEKKATKSKAKVKTEPKADSKKAESKPKADGAKKEKADKPKPEKSKPERSKKDAGQDKPKKSEPKKSEPKKSEKDKPADSKKKGAE